MNSNKVTVYSCSGCSNVAQLANNVAVRLHRNGEATMSCIAGVGGDVRPLVMAAQKAEKILALDGCSLACVQHCLKRHGREPDVHIVLTELGLSKKPTEDVTPEVAEEFYQKGLEIVKELRGPGLVPVTNGHGSCDAVSP